MSQTTRVIRAVAVTDTEPFALLALAVADCGPADDRSSHSQTGSPTNCCSFGPGDEAIAGAGTASIRCALAANTAGDGSAGGPAGGLANQTMPPAVPRTPGHDTSYQLPVPGGCWSTVSVGGGWNVVSKP